MDDILFTGSSYFIDMPINTTWSISTIEPISDYFTIRVALPERISIS